jgi:hypothetical protein
MCTRQKKKKTKEVITVQMKKRKALHKTNPSLELTPGHPLCDALQQSPSQDLAEEVHTSARRSRLVGDLGEGKV